jgi:hypothetical protein
MPSGRRTAPAKVRPSKLKVTRCSAIGQVPLVDAVGWGALLLENKQMK